MAQYEILRSLDRGGMAEVFLARLVGVEGFEKRVVLKRVLPHLSGDAGLLARFVDEARVAATLSHPNIVQIFELGEQHGQYFIAMEHVDGRNLKDVAKRLFARGERVPAEHAVRIGGAVLDALHYAHTRTDDEGRPVELVHRDVSPSNVLVSFDGVVKLIDFGIARHTTRVERTSPGTVIGKAGYMSPEQMRGERVDARTDVFACAATLFHLVTGTLPFPGVGVAAVMQAVHQGQRRGYEEVRETLDEELFRLLAKGFTHDPAQRFQSAREMQLALEGYAAARGIMASTAALSELMRASFARDDEEEGAPLDAETQSRVITLGHGAFSTGTAAAVAPATRTAPSPRASWGWVGVLGVLGLMSILGGGVAWWVVGERGGASLPVMAVASVSEPEPVSESAPATEPATAPTTATAPAPATATATATATASEPASEPEPATATATATASGVGRGGARSSTAEPVAARAEGRRTASRRAPASLTLDSEPWSEVAINGKPVGLTPLHALELPAGRHALHLVNPESKLEKTLTITLRAGESRRLRLALE